LLWLLARKKKTHLLLQLQLPLQKPLLLLLLQHQLLLTLLLPLRRLLRPLRTQLLLLRTLLRLLRLLLLQLLRSNISWRKKPACGPVFFRPQICPGPGSRVAPCCCGART
jgi:hypothetical protein